MRRIVPILLTAVLLLAGCSSNSEVETAAAEKSMVETTTAEESTSPVETASMEEIVTSTNAEATEITESSVEQTSTNNSAKATVNEEAVYMYLNNLLDSDKNPANDPNLPNITGLKHGTPEFDKVMKDFKEACQRYEDNATQKTADYFELSLDEVNVIFINHVAK